MSDLHVPTRPGGWPRAAEPGPGAREARLSLYFLVWVLAAPFVGFGLAETVFDLGAEGGWEAWKAAVIGLLMMAPFAVGAYFGLRAVLKRCVRGWVGLLGNVTLAVLAIGMPIVEAVTG